MKITNKKNYKIVEDEKNDLAGFANYLTKNISKFRNENVVVDILEKGDLELEELLMFLEVSNYHRHLKKSFVIANNAINIDVLPDELLVVPTLQEAEDVINMEELERELGF